jgi:hypothetical protein
MPAVRSPTGAELNYYQPAQVMTPFLFNAESLARTPGSVVSNDTV